MRTKTIVVAAALAVVGALRIGMLTASSVEAHGGGLNRCGCHDDRRTRTCHRHDDDGCGCECEPQRCR